VTIDVSARTNDRLKQADLLGFFTHPGTISDYLDLVETSVKNGKIISIYYHNLHTVYVYLSEDRFKHSYFNKTVLIDGMVLLFIYRLAGYSLSRDYRVTYVEFIIPLMTLARNNNYRVFHIGQQTADLEKALDVIRDQVPGIEISGHHGYFDQAETSADTVAMVDMVNEFSPDILLVGLGSPNQEYWVDVNRDKLNVPVVLTCGSCMDYLAGKVNAAPRWMSRIGLEAIYRVYADPKRLAYRYIVEPVLLLKILFLNKIKK